MCNNKKISRIAIFSFYDKQGYVDDYVIKLLSSLYKVVSRLIIVINGQIDKRGWNLFCKFTNEVYTRKNCGYDAGAYKFVLTTVLKENELEFYDEVVFCNDTFYGPLNSFEKIFEEMECRDCDFWGLNGFFNVVFAHIQSYFLVFRKEIINKHLLLIYFKENINEMTMEINDVYCQFETGLFDFLYRQSKMKYEIYISECDCDVYRSSYIYLTKYNLPIIKKKTFSDIKKDFDNIWCTLSFIKYQTEYDVCLILKSIQRIYGLHIAKEEIKRLDQYHLPEIVEAPVPLINDQQIEEFLKENEFYIYGAGMYASKAYWRFAKNNIYFRGFVVSDGMRNKKILQMFGHRIYEYSEIKEIEKKKILFGLSKKHALDVMKNFKDTSNLQRIF